MEGANRATHIAHAASAAKCITGDFLMGNSEPDIFRCRLSINRVTASADSNVKLPLYQLGPILNPELRTEILQNGNVRSRKGLRNQDSRRSAHRIVFRQPCSDAR